MNDPQSKLNRRRVFAGAGTLGALAAVAAVLPAARQASPLKAAATPEAGDDAKESGGYRLSAHVQRYYETTKV